MSANTENVTEKDKMVGVELSEAKEIAAKATPKKASRKSVKADLVPSNAVIHAELVAGVDDEDDEVYPNSESDRDDMIIKQAGIEEWASKTSGLDSDTIKTAFNAAWDAICSALEQGYTVKLHGKGRFYLSRRSSRIGRNPATGEEYDVPEREAMAFQTSAAYAKRLRAYRKMVEEKSRMEQEAGSDEQAAVVDSAETM